MVSRLLPVTLSLALGLFLAWPVAGAQAQGGGGQPRGDGFQPQQYDQNHPAFKDIQREDSLGREHIDGPVDYGTQFPTSGPHAARPTPPGFYDKPQSREALVHALEHGNIVIYYDTPGKAGLKAIRNWTEQYRGALDGVVAVPHEGLGEGIVLTAWQRRLELAKLDARATFFIDTFRGRGPERGRP
jgi:hypothetical protein